jgi:hypothetical protein
MGELQNVGGEVSSAALRLEYPRLARRLKLMWWWGRVRRVLAVVGRTVLFAAALVFALMSCTRAYGQLIHGLGSLTRP